MGIATLMTAAGSFDHRATDGADGADGAELIKALKDLVENPTAGGVTAQLPA